MTGLRSWIVLTAVLAACGGVGAAPAPQNAAQPTDVAAIVAADMERQIAYMKGFADEACACAEAPCARLVDVRVRKALEAEVAEKLYSDEDAAKYQPPYHDRLTAEYARYGDCVAAVGAQASSFGVLAVAEFESVESFGCTCHDATCGREADERYASWQERLGTTKATADDRARIKASARRFNACVDAAYAASGERRGQDILDTLRTLRDRGCACSDDACRAAMVIEIDAWVDGVMHRPATEDVTAEMKPVAAELFACVPYDQPAARAAIAELTVLRDRACACTSADCADDVTEDLYDLGRRNEHTESGDAGVARFVAIYQELEACIVAAGGAPISGTP